MALYPKFPIVVTIRKRKDAITFLENMVVGDVAGIKKGSGTLTVITNEPGGIIDDTVITNV